MRTTRVLFVALRCTSYDFQNIDREEVRRLQCQATAVCSPFWFIFVSPFMAKSANLKFGTDISGRLLTTGKRIGPFNSDRRGATGVGMLMGLNDSFHLF